MKLTFAFFLLFASYCSYGQASKKTPVMPIDSSTGLITYSEVVPVHDVAKDELYTRARVWFAKTFKSANHVIQMEDKENGILIGKAAMKVYHKAMVTHYHGLINYTVTIQVKDGRFKYSISDFNHTASGATATNEDYGPCEEMINTKHNTMGVSHQSIYNQYFKQIKLEMEGLSNDIKTSLAKPATDTSDDW